MSERLITRQRVFFAAGAVGIGIGGVVLNRILHHKESEDDITLEGVDSKTATELAVSRTDVSDEIIDTDVLYIGVDDDETRAPNAQEVHAIVDIFVENERDIGDNGIYNQLARRAINGRVYIRRLLSQKGKDA